MSFNSLITQRPGVACSFTARSFTARPAACRQPASMREGRCASPVREQAASFFIESSRWSVVACQFLGVRERAILAATVRGT